MNTQIINANKKSKKSKPKVILIIVDEYDSEDEPIKNLLNRKPPAEPPAEPPAKRTYYFPDEVFNMIKELAGIYDIGINWNKKWSDIQSYYHLHRYCPSIHAMTQKYFRETGRDHPEIIRRAVWKDISTYIAPVPSYIHKEQKDWGTYEYIANLKTGQPLFPDEKALINRKEKFLNSLHDLAPSFTIPSWMRVGMLIGGGRIIKITNKNITIKWFKKTHISTVPKGLLQQYTFISTYRWIEKDDNETSTVSRRLGDYKEDNTLEETRTWCSMDN